MQFIKLLYQARTQRRNFCMDLVAQCIIRAGRTGPADPAAARPIILRTTFIDSKKHPTEAVAAGPIIFAKYNKYVAKLMSTIYICLRNSAGF